MNKNGVSGHQYSKSTPSRAPIAGITAALALFALFIAVGTLVGARWAQMERVRVLLAASTVRSSLESNVNVRAHLERGVVALFESNPSTTVQEFSSYVSALIREDKAVINVALLEGTTIKYVYPYERNKSAIGRDLLLVPEQAASVIEVIQSRHPMVSGPFTLVQGGMGLTSRMSIYPRIDGYARYWGQASVVIDSDELFRQAGITGHPALRLHLRSEDHSTGELKPIFGDAEVLGQDPVDLQVNLPGIAWILSAVPAEGWKARGLTVILISTVGAVMAGLAGFMIYSLIHTREALREMAYHDQLTDLPNRTLFWDRLNVELSRAERDKRGACICMIDLDNFKLVNDNYGHEAGDRLLIAIAGRLEAATRKSDTVARIGGDEFAVIAAVDDDTGVEEVRERLRECWTRPFDLGVVVMNSGSSIGSALYPADGIDAETLLAVADTRMYQIKRSKR
jgi:diguanylate cyclase (GGDEF)-like protein